MYECFQFVGVHYYEHINHYWFIQESNSFSEMTETYLILIEEIYLSSFK